MSIGHGEAGLTASGIEVLDLGPNVAGALPLRPPRCQLAVAPAVVPTHLAGLDVQDPEQLGFVIKHAAHGQVVDRPLAVARPASPVALRPRRGLAAAAS